MSEHFEFTSENKERVKQFVGRYPEGRQQSAVMPLLDLAQRQNGGWLPEGAVEAIAEILQMPPIRVLEVATFYSMYKLKPVGRRLVNVCTTTPCWLRGSEQIVTACEQALGIKLGETTPDGEFTLGEVECLGACVNAPVVQIADDYFEDLDAESIARVIEALKRGETPPPGSQTGRQSSAPEGGPQVLTGAVKAPKKKAPPKEVAPAGKKAKAPPEEDAPAGEQAKAPPEEDAPAGEQAEAPPEEDVPAGEQAEAPPEEDVPAGKKAKAPPEEDAPAGEQAKAPPEEDAPSGKKAKAPPEAGKAKD